MSFSLEFYSLSWDALRTALSERKPELIEAVKAQQWAKLMSDDDLGPHRTMFNNASVDKDDPSQHVDALFTAALDEIGQAMKRPVPSNRDPYDISDHAALVYAAFVRQLGKPVGKVAQDVPMGPDPSLQLNFREGFLSGVLGSCFDDHTIGQKLAARTMFGLFHLDFVAWGGLTQQEITALLPKYTLNADQKLSTEWRSVGNYADVWLQTIVPALHAAADAKTDLATLYLTVQHQYKAFAKEGFEEGLGDVGRALRDAIFTERRRTWGR